MTRYTPLWEQAGSYAASVDRRLIAALWPGPAVSGCAVSAVSGQMQVNVAAGTAAVPSQNSTGSTLCVSDAVEPVPINSPPTTVGQSRIDLVTCHPRANDLDGGTNNDFIFDTVSGVPAASPTPPAVPAGQVALAQVVVAQGVVQIVPANITDVRPAGGLAAVPASSPRGTVAQATTTASTSATTSNVDWFTAPAFTVDGTRRVRVSFTGFINSSIANAVVGFRLMEGAAILQTAQGAAPAVGGPGQVTVTGVWEGVPAAGAHTYKVNVVSVGGSASVNGIAGANNPAVLIVEDVGQ
jgi:hypothetical protein